MTRDPYDRGTLGETWVQDQMARARPLDREALGRAGQMPPDDIERARWMEDYNGELGAMVLVLILGAALGGAALGGLLWLVVEALL